MMDIGPRLPPRQQARLAWQVLRFKLYLLGWHLRLRLTEGV